MGRDDLNDLRTLDALHEVAAELGEANVARSVRSFPLPLDSEGQRSMIPNYFVIEPPFSFSAVSKFEGEMIRADIELGNIVAKYTPVDFLDSLKPQLLPVRNAEGEVVMVYFNPTQDPNMSAESLEQHKKTAIIQFLQRKINYHRGREQARGRGWLHNQVMREKFEGILERYRDSRSVTPLRSRRQQPHNSR